MHKSIKQKYKRNLKLVLYDITNYYFETNKSDELRKLGVSKEKKLNPIVQMGLLIDQNKIPIGYELFPGNTHDAKTLEPMLNKLKTKFGFKRTLIVADKGVNTSWNLLSIVKEDNGYILSQKVRGSKKEFINEVLNDEGYTYWGDSFKYKEFFRKRIISGQNGGELKEKVIVYWSKNFDIREQCKHDELNKKIAKFLASPSTLNASNAYGIKRYIKTMHQNKETGTVEKVKPVNVFNQVKYNHDEALDDYYALVTSELDKPVKEIIASYHELWKIEESFKVIKSDLEGRPVFVRKEDRIQGHFLICFIALLILRIIELNLESKFSSNQIRSGIKEATCKEFANGLYSIEKQSPLIQELEKLSRAFLNYETCTLEEIRRFRTQVLHSIF